MRVPGSGHLHTPAEHNVLLVGAWTLPQHARLCILLTVTKNVPLECATATIPLPSHTIL
jgi:hypothetical protein